MDPASKTVTWSYPLDSGSLSSPAVEFRSTLGVCYNLEHCTPPPDYYDILYVASGKTLYGFDIKANHDTLACSASLAYASGTSSPVVIPNALLIGDTAGNLVGFDTTACKSGLPNAAMVNVLGLPLAPGIPIASSPIVADGSVYVDTEYGFFALQ